MARAFTHRPILRRRGDLPLLDSAGALDYLDAVRDRSLAVLGERGAGDGTLVELVLRHELQHTETMRQAMALGGLLPPGEPPAGPTSRASPRCSGRCGGAAA